MRKLVMATVLGLVVTSGLSAQSFHRGRGIMRPHDMKRPSMDGGSSEDGDSRKRPPMGHKMRPVFAARGFAIGGEGYELFGLNILPAKPFRGRMNEAGEGVDETIVNEDSLKEHKGVLGMAETPYLLKDIEIEFTELEGQDQSEDNEENSEAVREPRKVVSSIKATLCRAPEREALDEEPSDNASESTDEATEKRFIDSLEEVGTLSLTVEIKESKQMKVPVARGEVTLTDGTYELYAVLGKGPHPQMRRGRDEGSAEAESNEESIEE